MENHKICHLDGYDEFPIWIHSKQNKVIYYTEQLYIVLIFKASFVCTLKYSEPTAGCHAS